MRDIVVVLCMTVVAAALGIGLRLQFGLPLWTSVVAASSLYVALLLTHMLVRRSQQIDELQTVLTRLEDKISLQRGGSRTAPPAHSPAPDLASGPSLAAAPALAPVMAPPEPEVPSLSTPELTPEQGQSMAAAVAQDYWKFSPASQPIPSAGGTDQLSLDLPASQQWRESPELHLPMSVDVPVDASSDPSAISAEAEHINAVIKKIAADITQGQAAIAHTAATREPQPEDVDSSVAALQAVADAMRVSGFSVEEPQTGSVQAAAPARPAPPVLPLPIRDVDAPSRERLAAVAEAIERERFDVMLEPILSLGDRRAQHYIVTLRMRSEADQSAIDAAGKLTARGEGLLPLLDAVKVERAARVAWRMEDRGKTGALFSQLSGESLVSDRFLNRFAGTYRQGDTLGSRLVLTFRQDELRNFSELQWSTIRDMADLGFRFCIEDVTDLDIDFDALAAAGFTFVKLDAAVFLNGLPAAGGLIPAADICRHFTDLNLAVIVGGIGEDAVSVTLKSYGVELGQGRLFGGPRAVKSDVLRNPQAA